MTDLADYPAAQATLEEAIQIRAELGEHKNLLSTQVALARLQIARGEWEAALNTLQEFLDRALLLFEQPGQPDRQAERIAELERVAGRLALQLEMAKKASSLMGPPH